MRSTGIAATLAGGKSCSTEKILLPSPSVSESRNRSTFPVSVSGEAREILDAANEEFGINRTELTARLYELYAKWPKSVRREAIDKNGDVAGELVRLRMAEMASTGEKDLMSGVTFKDAAAVARAALDRVVMMSELYQRELKERLDAESKRKKG